MTFTTAQRQTFAWLGLAFLGLLAVWLLAPVLAPFIVAAVRGRVLHLLGVAWPVSTLLVVAARWARATCPSSALCQG